MRKFNEIIFLGACNEWDEKLLSVTTREATLKENPLAEHSSTFLSVELLRLRVGQAISLLSCLQQGEIEPGSIKNLKEFYEKDLIDSVRDIAVALTGYEIEFVKKVPSFGISPEFGDKKELVERIYENRLRLAQKVLGTL